MPVTLAGRVADKFGLGLNGLIVKAFPYASTTPIATTATTDGGDGFPGYWEFSGLPDGTYTIQVETPQGIQTIYGPSSVQFNNITVGAGAAFITDSGGVFANLVDADQVIGDRLQSNNHLTIGSFPAQQGTIRLPHGGSIWGRNSTNTGDNELIRWGSDKLIFPSGIYMGNQAIREVYSIEQFDPNIWRLTNSGDFFLRGLIDFSDTEGDKLRFWQSTYGIGINSSELAIWSGANFAFRLNSRTGTLLASLSGAGDLTLSRHATIGGNATITGQLKAGTYWSPLVLAPENAAGGVEGGQIVLQGAGSNPNWAIDLYNNTLRFHTGGVTVFEINPSGNLTVQGALQANGGFKVPGGGATITGTAGLVQALVGGASGITRFEVVTGDNHSIRLLPSTAADNYNPIVEGGDSVIVGGGAAIGTWATTLTHWSNTAVGFRLRPDGVINYWGSLQAASDERLKDIEGEITGAMSAIRSWRAIRFTWLDPKQGAGPQIGLVAQDIQSNFPEIVSSINWDGDTYLSLDYSRVVPVLVAAIKGLDARLSALEGEGGGS